MIAQKKTVTKSNTHNIRGLDLELLHKARVAALKAKQTLGQWINQAVKEKLEKDGE